MGCGGRFEIGRLYMLETKLGIIYSRRMRSSAYRSLSLLSASGSWWPQAGCGWSERVDGFAPGAW